MGARSSVRFGTLASVRRRSPATVFLQRAQLIFMLAALVPTALMAVIGIVLLATRRSHAVALVSGILVLVFCAMALLGYVLGSIFVSRGANLASIQNDFLSAVSHEVRTPLTSIRMFIDTLREDRVSDPDEKRRCLTLVHQELTRLDTLVTRLIQLSRLESRSVLFEHTEVDVRALVDEALTGFRALDLTDEVDLRIDVPAGLVVRGDRSALVQALVNLLANAHKYTRPEDKVIEVRAEGDSRRVSISVTDNGYGITPEEQKTIFDKFKRGTAATRAPTIGTGLGLAIVRATVEAHGGEISVSSELHKMSRFCIALPRVVPPHV